MPNVLAIHAVGESLRSHLAAGYPGELRERYPCEFRLLATGEIGAAAPGLEGALTLLLHRVTPSPQSAGAPPVDGQAPASAPPSLDLHYLLTAWAGTARAEQTLLAWAARQLHQRPVLDAASLGSAAGWSAGDAIQVVPVELSVEDMMRVWTGLGVPYRLSLSYVARAVRIDTGDVPPETGEEAEETGAGPKRIEGVRTSTTGFVGVASHGPVWAPDAPAAGVPRLLTSFADFERGYGGVADPASGPNRLAHAVRAYFDNGGARLFVSRVRQPAGGGAPAADAYVTALRALEEIEEISVVAAPDAAAHPELVPAVHAALVAHAERPGSHRFAVLDTPAGLTPTGALEVRRAVDSTRAALYFPWVIVPDPQARPEDAGAAAEIALPPSGVVCGVYARTDAQRGVWAAPANEEVLGALRLEAEVSRAQQELLNPAGVNCLRAFHGRGILVWGARTASADPEFRYVQVRRYLDYLERSIDRGIRWAMSEPNGEPLWAAVRLAVERFLTDEWRAGALLGTTTSEAFFVRCDRTTMTPADIDEGRLVCLAGVAVTKPAEFVIFRVGR